MNANFEPARFCWGARTGRSSSFGRGEALVMGRSRPVDLVGALEIACSRHFVFAGAVEVAARAWPRVADGLMAAQARHAAAHDSKCVRDPILEPQTTRHFCSRSFRNSECFYKHPSVGTQTNGLPQPSSQQNGFAPNTPFAKGSSNFRLFSSVGMPFHVKLSQSGTLL